MEKEYDAIIVGAGPAGCSAAICLARLGYGVLLMDKAVFPRDKVCGDGIGPGALEVLDRLGVLKEVSAREPWRVEGIHLYSPSGQQVLSPFSHLNGRYKHGLALPRRELDFVLWERAHSSPGINAMENCEFLHLLRRDSGVIGVRARRGKDEREFRGKTVLGADGVYSRVAKDLGFSKDIFHNYSLAVRGYFQQVEGLTHCIEIHCEKSLLPGYGWVFPTGKESANVGVGIASRYLRKRDLKKLFQEFIENPSLGARFRRARLVENSLKGGAIPMCGFLRRRSFNNVLLLGDAGGFTDVLTGEGVYYALRGGECAAEAVQESLQSEVGESASRVYERSWRRLFSPKEFFIGNLIQRWAIGEFFLNRNIRRARRKPAMARTLASILCHEKTRLRLLL